MLGFSFGVSLFTGLLCGLAPALKSTRPDLVSSLKNEIRTAGRGRPDLRSLVMVQVALSLLLLIGAGLFLRSLRNLKTLDPGFSRERVLLVNVNPSASGYKGQGRAIFTSACRRGSAACPTSAWLVSPLRRRWPVHAGTAMCRSMSTSGSPRSGHTST